MTKTRKKKKSILILLSSLFILILFSLFFAKDGLIYFGEYFEDADISTFSKSKKSLPTPYVTNFSGEEFEEIVTDSGKDGDKTDPYQEEVVNESPSNKKYVAVVLSLGYSVDCLDDKVYEIKQLDLELVEAYKKSLACSSTYVVDEKCKEECNIERRECENICEDQNPKYDQKIECLSPCWSRDSECKAECDTQDKVNLQNLVNKCSEDIYSPVYSQLSELVSSYCKN